MKNMLRSIFFALVLASLVASLGFTAGGAAPSLQTAAGNEAIVSFNMLGESDTLLRGPYGTKTVRFGLPANWAFEEGGSLQLIMTANLISDASQAVAEGQFIGATMSVSFDKKTVATLPILAGSNVTYDIPIPATAVDSPFNDGRHELTLFLDAGADCNTNGSRQTSVVVSSTSFFTIPYAEQEPAIDLTSLPRPIFQRDSIFPEQVALVVPDKPTADEMQAALTVAAGFGRMSGGDMNVNLVPMSALTPEMRTESQLIFVGKSSGLSLLQGATLPSPVQGNAFAAPGMQDDDGVLQMAISPWNTGRAMLVVGGNTDAGVIKAAQALTNANIQTVGQRDLAVIANVLAPSVGTQPTTTVPQEMRTFSDLGYDILTMNGVGRSEVFVHFTVPPGFVATGDAYLDLTFNHSGLLDFNRSGLTVFMNGNLIGSVLLSQQTATTTTQRIKIPLSALETNNNELRFEVDLAPLSQCSFLDFSNLWFSILPESILNLPLAPATADTGSMRDLSSFPFPFTGEPTLAGLAYVLSENDPASWDTAAKISLQLGRYAAGVLFNPEVAFDGKVPEDILNTRSLIVVGLPTNMKILGELNESMPAPFEKGTNIAVLQGQQVAYRFPAESDLGFLELLQSPWNQEQVILAVVGTTPEGIRQAGDALTNGLLRSQLKGNFVLVNNQTLSVADTRTGLGLAGVSADGNASAQLPATSEEPVVEQQTPVFERGNVSWIPMVIGGLLIAIVVVVIIAALTRRRVVVP